MQGMGKMGARQVKRAADVTADHPNASFDRPLLTGAGAQVAQDLCVDYRILTVAARAQFRLYWAMGQPPLCALPKATELPVEVPVVPAETIIGPPRPAANQTGR